MRKIKIVIAFLIAASASSPSFAQWKSLIHFDGKRINCLYFMDEEGKPDWGVLGVYDTVTSEASLYYSRDAGKTWILSAFPAHLKSYNFAFKDNLTGWIGTTLKFSLNGGNRTDRDSSLLLITHDGGITWQGRPNGAIGVTWGPIFVCYNKKSSLLFLSGADRGIIASTDEGINFYQPPTRTNGLSSMIAFIDGIWGYRTVGAWTSYSTDGGNSWGATSYGFGVTDPRSYGSTVSRYRGLPISGTKTFFQIGNSAIVGPNDIYEYGLIYRSDDGAMTWDYVSELPQNLHLRPVPYLQGDIKRLYCETTDGVWISEDEGITWKSICGPSRNSADSVFTGSRMIGRDVDSTIGTPLYVKDNRIYIADDTGSLWFLDAKDIAPRIDYSTSVLSLNQVLCNPIDSVIEVFAHDLCSGVQGKLVSASLSGSPHFSFTSKAPPYSFTGNDTIGIRYSELLPVSDTAILSLRYQVGSQLFDTTITLIGTGKQVTESVKFIPLLSEAHAQTGSTTELFIIPDKIEMEKGLKSISFELNYNSDLLDRISFKTDIPGAMINLGTEARSGRITSVPVTISGTDIALDPTKNVATIKYRVMVTDTNATPISINHLKLNGGDPSYQNCVLSASSGDTTFTAMLQCGEPSLQKFIHTGSVVDITSIHPNPSLDEISLDIHSAVKQETVVAIFDALGANVLFKKISFEKGPNTIRLNTINLFGGIYLVRIGNSSQVFVKVR